MAGTTCTGCTDGDSRADGVDCNEIAGYSYLGASAAQKLLDHVRANPCGACVPDCSGKVCGDDGCGGVCGACAGQTVCQAGQCVSTCTPDCAGKACGDDGCGGSCGSCSGDEVCSAGACEPLPTGQCGDIAYEGQCDSGVVTYCSDGELKQISCNNGCCGWVGADVGFDCWQYCGYCDNECDSGSSGCSKVRSG